MFSNSSARICGWLLAWACLGLSCVAPQPARAGDMPGGPGQRFLDSGDSHNCGIYEDATLLCWPYSTMGPAPTTGRYIAVSVGYDHVCALRSNGAPTCWGAADAIATPPAPGPFVAISTGKGEACALRPNGRIACWGGMMAASAPTGPGYRAVSVADGRGCAIRGDGSIECWVAPGTASLGEDPAGRYLMVDTGSQHACAVAVDGRAICWGANDNGQSTPPATDRFTTVTVGQQHSCGLREDGTIRCWGRNDTGQTTSPTGQFITITAGRSHTCARTIEGYTQCWGGPNENRERSVPVQPYQSMAMGGGESCALDGQGYPACLTVETSLRPPMRRYKALSFGPTSACGVGIDDRLVCWGASLGATPTDAVSDVSVGHDHACAKRTQGQGLVCWGSNARGQTAAPAGNFYHLASGNGFSCGIRSDYYAFCWGSGPAVTQMPSLNDGYRSIAAHDGNVCAISTVNLVRCWGEDAASLSLPVQAETYHSISLGARHACARYGNNGSVTCWGDNTQGQLSAPVGISHSVVASSGNSSCALNTSTGAICWGETRGSKTVSTSILGAASIRAGTAHTCQSRGNGAVSCWGDDSFGQTTPIRTYVRAFDLSGDHGCAIAGDGALRCWGDDTHGGSTTPAGPARTLDAGQFSGCAVAGNGDAGCWGWNANGQGVPPAGAFRSVATGLNHSCGIRDDGTLACWGYDADGQSTPPAGQFTAVEVGERHSCAIAIDGTVQCWGLDSEGQATPPDLSGGTYRSLATGAFHNCGITAIGSLACWGRNDQGQASPPLEGVFLSVAAGFAHSCAIRDDGVRQCWGRSTEGQVPVLAITPATLPQASKGVPYRVDLGMTAPAYAAIAPRFRFISGSVPYGLALEQDGRLMGTIQGAPGNYTFAVSAIDDNGFVATRTYQMTVLDVTPPVIQPLYDGWTGGEREWYTANVTLSWQVTDAESPVTARTGCDTVLINQDTNGTTYECIATSAGGTSRRSVVIRRDTVPPDTAFDQTYPSVYYKDQWGIRVQPILFGFVASPDAGSGVAGFECAQGDSPATLAYRQCPSPVWPLGVGNTSPFPVDGRYRFNVRAKDQAGNVDPTPAFHDFYIRVDSTSPVVTPLLTGTIGDNAWYISDVHLRWQIEDPETPVTILDGCVDEVIAVDTASASRRCRASSLPGETLKFAGFKRDTLPPTIYALTDAVPNAAGWHRQDVRVAYTCSDMTSGVAGACPGVQTITQEGRDVSSDPRTIRDNAGLSATSGVITVNLDKTAPQIQATVSPLPNAAGWHRANATVSYACQDALSGLAQSCPSDQTVFQEGRSQVVTANIADLAGNSVGVNVWISLDRTPPTIRARAGTPPNANGWYREDVSVLFECADTLSGLAAPCPATQVLSQESSEASSVARVIADVAGNSTESNVVTVRIDKTAPTLTVTMPPAKLVLNASHDFALGAADALSGVASQSCTGFSTATLGTRTVTCSATDRAGNTTSRSSVYSVEKRRITGGPSLPEQRPAPVQRPIQGRPVPGALRPAPSRPRVR